MTNAKMTVATTQPHYAYITSFHITDDHNNTQTSKATMAIAVYMNIQDELHSNVHVAASQTH